MGRPFDDLEADAFAGVGISGSPESADLAAAENLPLDEWRRRWATTVFMANRLEVDPRLVRDHFDRYRDLVFGEGCTNDLAYQVALAAHGGGDALPLNKPNPTGLLADLDKTFADWIKPNPSDAETLAEFPQEAPGGPTFMGEAGQAAMRSSANFFASGLAGAAGLARLTETARQINAQNRNFQTFLAADPTWAEKMQEVAGSWESLGNKEWWALRGGEVAATTANFAALYAAGGGAAGMLAKALFPARTAEMLAAGVAGMSKAYEATVQASLITGWGALMESGDVLASIDEQTAGNRNASRAMLDKIDSLPKDDLHRLEYESLVAGLAEYRRYQQRGQDQDLAVAAARKAFWRNMVVGVALEGTTFFMGKVALAKVLQGAKGRVATGFGLWGTGAILEADQELAQQDISEKAAAQAVLGTALDLDLLPMSFWSTMFGDDRQRKDIAITALVQSLGMGFGRVASDMHAAKTLSEQAVIARQTQDACLSSPNQEVRDIGQRIKNEADLAGKAAVIVGAAAKEVSVKLTETNALAAVREKMDTGIELEVSNVEAAAKSAEAQVRVKPAAKPRALGEQTLIEVARSDFPKIYVSKEDRRELKNANVQVPPNRMTSDRKYSDYAATAEAVYARWPGLGVRPDDDIAAVFTKLYQGSAKAAEEAMPELVMADTMEVGERFESNGRILTVVDKHQDGGIVAASPDGNMVFAGPEEVVADAATFRGKADAAELEAARTAVTELFGDTSLVGAGGREYARILLEQEQAPSAEAAPAEGEAPFSLQAAGARHMDAEVRAGLESELAKHPELKDVKVEVIEGLLKTSEGQDAVGKVERGIITVSLQAEKPVKVGREEIFHELLNRGVLTSGQLDVLVKHEAEWRSKYGIDALYRTATEDRKLEEALAHAYASMPSEQKTVMQKVMAFFEALGNWIRGLGFKTAEDVFRELEGGKVKAETRKKGQARYSLAESREEPGMGWKRPENKAAVVLAGLILDGRKMGLAEAKRHLKPFKLEGQAESILDAAQRTVADFQAKKLGWKSDPMIRMELRKSEVAQRYEKVIEEVHAAAFGAGRYTERARAELAAAAKKLHEQRLALRRGMTSDELKAAGFDAAREVEAVLPQPRPVKESKPAESATAEGEEAPAESATEPPPAESAESAKPAESAETTPALEVPPVEPQQFEAFAGKLRAQVRDMEIAEGVFTERNSRWAADPTFKADYIKTWQGLIKDLAHKLELGNYARERVLTSIDGLAERTTLASIEREARRLLDMANRGRIRENRQQLLAKFDRLAHRKALMGQAATRMELEKRKIDPASRRWLRVVKSVADLSLETVKGRLNRLAEFWNDIQGPAHTDALKADEFRRELEAWIPEFKFEPWYKAQDNETLAMVAGTALSQYGALRHRPLGEIADAVARFEEDLHGGIERIAKRIEELRAKAEADAKTMVEGVKPPAPLEHKGGMAQAAKRMAVSGATFWDKFNLLAHDSTDAAAAKMEALGDKWGHRNQKCLDRKVTMIREYTAKVDLALEKIFQMPAWRARRELRKERPELKEFSKNADRPRHLSCQEALQIISYAEQKNYLDGSLKHGRDADYIARLKKALPPEALVFLDALREFYRQTRGPISDTAELICGMGVQQADPLYMPMQLLLPVKGPETIVRDSFLLPGGLTDRVRHEYDVDETCGVLDMLDRRVSEFSHFVAYGEFSRDLRAVLGREEVNGVIRNVHGGSVLKEFRGHWTDIINGGFKADYHNAALDWLARLTAYNYLSFRVASGLRQYTGTIQFGHKIGLEKVGEYMLTAASEDGVRAMREIFHSDEWKNRYWQGPNELLENALMAPTVNQVMDKLKKGMIVPAAGDMAAVLQVGQGIYRDAEQRALRMGMDAKAARQEALTHLFYIVNQTQQGTDPSVRPEWSRRGGKFGRYVSMFMQNPAQMLSLEYAALDKVLAGRPGAWRELMNAVLINHLLAPVAIASVGVLMKALVGEEKDKDWWKTYLAYMVAGPVGGMVLIGNLTETAIQTMIRGKAYYGSTLPGDWTVKGSVTAWDVLKHLSFDFDLDEALFDMDRLGRDLSGTYKDVSKFYEHRIANE